MPGIVLLFPMLPGQVEAWRHSCQRLGGSRAIMYAASRRQLGFTRERIALLENNLGAAWLATLEAQDIGQTPGQIIPSDLRFDCWYRERLVEPHGVSLTGCSAPGPAVRVAVARRPERFSVVDVTTVSQRPPGIQRPAQEREPGSPRNDRHSSLAPAAGAKTRQTGGLWHRQPQQWRSTEP